MKFRLPVALLTLIFYISATAQDFSNKGKDFWVGYGTHVAMYNTVNGTSIAGGGAQEMVLYFTSDQTANVTVQIPATGYSANYTVTPNTVTESAPIPKTGTNDARLASEGVSNKGIHITSDKPIVAYAHIYDGAISGASLLFPTNTLGRDYYTLGFTQISNANYAYPFAFVIATEDSTVVEVTPSAATLSHPAGVTFTQALKKGEILNLLGQISGQSGVDLTGTRIRSIATGTSGCKKIAVFCGTGKINIKCTATGAASADNTIQQCFPSNAWGIKYITVPTRDMPNNFFRIMVNDPTTVVTRNGGVMSGLINGRYYEFQSNVTNLIESNKPIIVAQFITTTGQCGNSFIGNNGDPEMIYLSPTEQTISKVTLNSTTHAAIDPNYHYINVVMKNAGVSSFTLDGVNRSASFAPLPNDPSYSFVQFKTTPGIHNLQSDSGFNAIAYGYGQAETYGYNAGTNVLDLYQFVSLQNQYATVNFPATCKNTPFFFSITLPYLATSLSWDFSNNPNLSPNVPVVNNSPTPDSTFIRDGKTLYVYKLPSIYSFSSTGTYPVKVIANNPTSDGCSGTQEINYDVVVYDPPQANFTYTYTGCITDSVHFVDSSDGFGRQVNRWRWDFGDATIDSVKNPVKKFSTAGTYNVHLRSITDIGCIADTTKPIFLSSVPVASFKNSATTCVNTSITFTDSSVISTGTIVKWSWNFGNGNTIVNTTNAPVTQTYATAGNYTVTLQVESNSGCKSIIYSKTIIVHPAPVADFNLPGVCLPSGLAQFQNLTTISDGTVSSIKYSWNFGDSGTDTVKNPVHTYTSTGPFTIILQATSIFGCVKDTTKIFSNIYPAAHADFTATAEVCLRDTTVFTDQSNGAGNSVVKWRWSFGDNTTDTLQNPKHRYAAAGTYTVKLFIYTDKGCISDTMTKTTIVNPLPTPDFVTSSPACATKQITVTDQSAANSGTINQWYWDFGDATNATYNNGNPFQKVYAAVGTYTIKLAMQSNKGCKSDTLSKPVTIYSPPVANFILPEVCLSDAFAQFTDSSFIADGTDSSFTYAWNFGDANATVTNPNTSSVKSPKHKYTATGIYSVVLTVTSTHGCTSTLTRQFVVNGDIPASDFTILNAAGLCSNTRVQIQNASSVNFGSITKIEIVWDAIGAPAVTFTDDLPTPGKIYSHTYSDFQSPLTKTFQVRFLAYSGGTCVDVKTKTITVNASPKVLFSTMPGICLDAAPRQITQAVETGGVPGMPFYSGTGVSQAGVFNPAAPGAGTYPIQYLYISNMGCRDSATKTITVWPSPVAKWGYSTPTCEANGITFTDSSVANFSNLSQWKWNFGDGITLSRNNKNPFSKTFALAGNYNVNLQVVTDSGCQSQATMKAISVHYLPRVDFSLPSVCLPGGLAQFNDLSVIPDNTQSSFTYSWSFGDPNDPSASTQKNPVHKYSALGPYSVKLIVTSGNGCVDSLRRQLTTVYPPPVAGFTFTPGEVCLGGTFAFTDTSKGITGSITGWLWDFNDGTTSASQNPSKKYSVAGTYTVNLLITNQQGCTDTAAYPVRVNSYPGANAGPDLFVLEGGNVIITPSVSGNELHYRWTPPLYLDSDTALNPRTTPLADVTYKLTVTGRGGCANSDDVFIKVLLAPVIPNAFSPNGDGINDTWIIQYLESYQGATVQVFNRYGQLVFSSLGYTKPWDGKYNSTILPVGTYYYIIDPKNGRKQMSGSVTILR